MPCRCHAAFGLATAASAIIAAAAVVRPKEKQDITEEEIVKCCGDKGLAGFKLPRKVYFVSEFPTTLTGKILKRELKEKYKNMV